MPILWRYLLRSYFEVFSLCTSAIVGILLVTRFQDIARFAALGAPKLSVLAFVLYQLPYLLIYAIPISCLIATLLLFQRLSHSHELTAFRAAGIGIKTIAFPLVLGGIIVALFNLTVVSELAPRCRTYTRELTYDVMAINPLYLLQKDPLTKIKNTFVDMKQLRLGKYAEDVAFVTVNQSQGRLCLMLAKELSLDKQLLTGNQVSLISYADPKRSESFDHLIVENQAQMSTQAENLSRFMRSSHWILHTDYLPLRLLFIKDMIKSHCKLFTLGDAKVEVIRRISLGLAALSFTFLGIGCGMQVGRNRSKKGVASATLLAALFILCFLTAKSMRHSTLLPSLLFILPHPLLIGCSLYFLKRLGEGKE